MKPGSLVRWLSMFGMAAMLAVRAASAADVQVMISSGFYGVYSALGPAFERASGHHLVTTRGPSMGDSPESIPTRLAQGEAADVVILDGGAADALGRRGLVRADSKVNLARSLIGMVVRAGAAKPDIGSVEAFRNALLAAKSIAYSDSSSGTYLSTKLFPSLGIAEEMKAKTKAQAGPPQIAPAVAKGEAELGVFLTNVLIAPGVELAGSFPADLQQELVFTAAVAADSKEADAAQAFIHFLTTPAAAAAIKAGGMNPG